MRKAPCPNFFDPVAAFSDTEILPHGRSLGQIDRNLKEAQEKIVAKRRNKAPIRYLKSPVASSRSSQHQP
jgi:hypothetical protein